MAPSVGLAPANFHSFLTRSAASIPVGPLRVLLVVRLVLDSHPVRAAAREVVERLRTRGHLGGREEALHREIPVVPEAHEVGRLETLATGR